VSIVAAAVDHHRQPIEQVAQASVAGLQILAPLHLSADIGKTDDEAIREPPQTCFDPARLARADQAAQQQHLGI